MLPLLRRRLAGHNRQVAGLSLAALLAAVLLWLAAYGGCYWLTLLALTAVFGDEAGPPRYFDSSFLTVALALLILAWLMARARPDQRARDAKSPGEVVFDFLLLIPRVTLSIWGNLSAWLSLSHTELALAAGLLERLQTERKLPLGSVPLEVPDEETRERVLLSLSLLRLLELRREEGSMWLRPLELPAPKTLPRA